MDREAVTLAASLDGSHVAMLRDGALVLYSVEPFAALGALALGVHDAELAFVDRQVLVRAGDKLVLVATAPRFAIVDEHQLAGTTGVRAVSGNYALVDRGGELVVATCTSTALAAAPMRAHVVARHAVGLDQARFLIWSDPIADLWSATTRQPTARLSIELPPNAAAVGTATQQRSVWIATASGELTISRVSDGRTLAIDLPGPPSEIASHPMSAWLLADVAGEPHAINCALRSSMRVAVPRGRRILVPAQADAYVIVDEGDRLGRYAFNADSSPAYVSHHALPNGEDVVAVPQAPDEPPPAPARRPWERSRAVLERASTAAPDEIATEPAVPAVEPAHEPRPPARAAAPAPVIVRATSRREHTDWRDILWRWSRRVLGGAFDDPLPSDGSPLEQLCDRSDLATAPRRVLALLYAEWLAGKGDTGVAAATLAEVAGPGGWAEALGTGRLAELGFVTSAFGRCVLSRELGATLDRGTV